MFFKLKTTKPKRDDFEYKEIENFEDFELLNNAVYEMAIRTKEVKELFKIYNFCESSIDKIKKFVVSNKYDEQIKKKEQIINTEILPNEINMEYKTPEENFQIELKRFESNLLLNKDDELYKLLTLNLDIFKEKIGIFPLEEKTINEMEEASSKLSTLLYTIYEIIQKEYYIDFFENIETKKHEKVEYDESIATSLYIKREFKDNYYIETVIDADNNKLTKTMYPLTKRKLFTDHILRFSSNHLIFYKEIIKFIEKFFKVNDKTMKKQKTLADAFFCYDYYRYRLEQVNRKNKEAELKNSNNIFLQEALFNMSKIDNNKSISAQQKNEGKSEYIKTKEREEIKLKSTPSINKTSNYYIFNEKDFLKSGINKNTALTYYQWISPYIDDMKYKDIINGKI
ncbi:hypothetical protein [Aliarcobacter butzleri]|uniref:hypothetical protein n=1 Tax=Aliarcobacter butzleri TaxID=28197 RepID=UPI002B244994|nr:hypothetical protein [Aliarcobacter butzleri]